ncbi:MAG: hypothetical protein HQK54_08075 [Oligoflexales bacterium]|nr:hypothetical protein [Oligoflexales bacterium]
MDNRGRIVFIFLTFAAFSASFSPPVFPVQSSETDTGHSIPVLKTLGIIPVRWEASAQDLFDLDISKEKVDRIFFDSVHQAKRFRVINDVVTKELWSFPEGRSELKEQYELDAYINLSVHAGYDVISFAVRLLSPTLKETYLLESDSISRTVFKNNTKNEILEKIQNLVFRLLNRIPVDVNVSSIQGEFITVTGGRNQNISLGDELIFYHTEINGTHPKNGSWISFTQKELGAAEVVELKNNSAVAKISRLNYEGAINIGDGARVNSINSRKKFHRLAETSDLEKQDNDSVIVTPKYRTKNKTESGTPKERASVAASSPAPAPDSAALSNKSTPAPLIASTEVPPATKADEPKKEEDLALTKNDNPTSNKEPEEKVPSEIDNDENSLTNEESRFSMFLRSFDDAIFHFTHKNWSVYGDVNARTGIPFWLVNQTGVLLRKEISGSNMRAEYFGNFGVGPTSNGSFIEFGLGSRLMFKSSLQTRSGILDRYEIGPTVNFDYLTVSGEDFGGIDLLGIGAQFKIAGNVENPLRPGQPSVWENTIDLIPIGFGNGVIMGSRRTIRNLSLLKISGSFLMNEESNPYNWGTFLTMSLGEYKLKDNSISKTELIIGALLRHAF